jgi:AAA+ superfamily predicted ATPase
MSSSSIFVLDALAALRKYLVGMSVKQRQLFDRCLRERVLVLLVFCSSMKSMHLLELAASAAGGESGGDVVQGRVLASFLMEMDGIGATDGGVVLVGATNRLEVRCHVHSSLIKHSTFPSSIAVFWKNDALQCIDAALLRSGRFDIKVCVLTS